MEKEEEVEGEMRENKVETVNKFGEKLVGIETIPSIEKDKYPTIILVHGFGVRKEENGMFDKIAEILSEEGLLSYRFDFSGCGESKGDYIETSLSKLKSDLEEILEFVKSQNKVDSSKIGILAQSFGTTVTVSLEPKVNCIVMMSSLSHPREVLEEVFDEYNPKGISKRIKSDGTLTEIKPQFWKDFENHSLLDSIKRINCPILFIHGELDDKAPISDMEAYYNNANEPKEKIILEGASHSLKPKRKEMHKLIVGWFKKYLL